MALKLQCKRCCHEWQSDKEKAEDVNRCPKCHSRKWNIELSLDKNTSNFCILFNCKSTQNKMLQKLRTNKYMLGHFNQGKEEADKLKIVSESDVLHYIINRFYISLAHSNNLEDKGLDKKMLRYFRKQKRLNKLKGVQKKWKT